MTNATDPFAGLPRPVDGEGIERDVSVIIATLERPDVLRVCLSHLADQTARPLEVLVVDASASPESKAVVSEFPWVHYLRNDAGVGTLPTSRRIGVERSSGAIIAFLDDDAYADPDWLQELIPAYGPGVGGVGGQARNDQPGELTTGVDEIGRFLSNGLLTGNFAADPGRIIEVDHMIGCNMSVRREVLEAAGGIPEWPAGVSALREDLFLSLRIRDAGYSLRFAPAAGVLHIGAPQVAGKRFDARYQFTGARNHLFVLIAHFGLGSPYVRRAALAMTVAAMKQATISTGGALFKLGATVVGLVVGIRRGISYPRR